MLRKLSLSLLFVAASLSPVAFSMEPHAIQQGITLEYDLPPNQPQLFINYTFWSIEANCKITGEDESDDLVAEALLKKGKVNGIPLTQGQMMNVTVHPGDNLLLSADSGAKVKITNLGAHTLKAICTA